VASENVPVVNPDLAQKQSRYVRKDVQDGKMNWYQTTGSHPIDSLQRFRDMGRPLEVNVSGWGGIHFTPHKFPREIKGGSDRQCHITQSIHMLNLRAPDLAYMTR